MPAKKRKKTLTPAGWKRTIITGSVVATIGLSFWATKASYTVREVVDGDTFVTKENQYIRFDKVDAPELNYCLGKEAKDELSHLILGKKVLIKVTYKEPERGRLVASVYTFKGDVQEQMLEKGLGTLRGGLKQENLNKATDIARKSKVGVFSSVCTQTVNPDKPKCNIKGNILHEVKYYRYPGCSQYSTTLVQLHFGEKWFCTESEAKSAGFTKGPDCP